MLDRVVAARASSTPVVLIGAARSGTKLLRDVVAAGSEFQAVPYDVNYVWRYRNAGHTNDALPLDAVDDHVRAFVRTTLPRIAGLRPRQRLVEKTVSNTLRIPFVHAVYPEALFVHIVRDGRDVVESAVRCWRERPSAGHLATKIRTFPWRRCAPYAIQYAKATGGRFLGLTDHVSTWGPRYPGIDADVPNLSLIEVCAKQWVACVEAVERDCHVLPPGRLLAVRYEDLVIDPRATGHRIAEFLGARQPRELVEAACRLVVDTHVGKHWRLGKAERARVEAVTAPTRQRWYSIEATE